MKNVINDLSKLFRNEVRDSDEMKNIYRQIRDIRDKVIVQVQAEKEQFIEYFDNLSVEEKLIFLVFLFDKVFGGDDEENM